MTSPARLRPYLAAVLLCASLASSAWALDESVRPQQSMAQRVEALIPALEAYIAKGMQDFDSPGLAIGIVTGDKLVYAKGFGVRSKDGGAPVDTKTVFQIGSATKAFLAAALAIAVDEEKLKWDDKVVDLDPGFQMHDAWVTREFRVFDLLAQRSGMPPYANDALALLGIEAPALIRSLRFVEPVSSFRSTFAYTNITHLVAGEVAAKALGEADWNAVLKKRLLQPLGMNETSYTAAAIEAAANHAEGYRWTPEGSVQVPFTQVFPYALGGAGDINSNIEDMSRWVRLQLGGGAFEGNRIVSAENLTATHTPKVALTDKKSYALGWVVQQTENGTIIWHNGGTSAFGAFVGLLPDKDAGVIVLTNETNFGFPDAVGIWTLEHLLGNPDKDHVAEALMNARKKVSEARKQFERPADPRPSPPLAPLAGDFAHPGAGKAALAFEDDALVLTLKESGARLKLEPFDGDIFAVRLMPLGRFAAMVENNGPLPLGFVQFQMDKDAKLNILRLSFDDGQAYDFTREQ